MGNVQGDKADTLPARYFCFGSRTSSGNYRRMAANPPHGYHSTTHEHQSVEAGPRATVMPDRQRLCRSRAGSTARSLGQRAGTTECTLGPPSLSDSPADVRHLHGTITVGPVGHGPGDKTQGVQRNTRVHPCASPNFIPGGGSVISPEQLARQRRDTGMDVPVLRTTRRTGPRQMLSFGGTNVRKQLLYLVVDDLLEIRAHAARLDRSMSWVVQQAWQIAKGEVHKFPAAPSTCNLMTQ